MTEKIGGVPLDEAARLIAEEDPEDWPEGFHEEIAPVVEWLEEITQRASETARAAVEELDEADRETLEGLV